MVFSLLLASTAIALIAWLVFNLSVYALPFFVGVSAASLAHRTGAGLVGSAIVGLIAGAVTFGVAKPRSTWRAPRWHARAWPQPSQCQRPSPVTIRRWGLSHSASQGKVGGRRSQS